ncbi:MULTISPECIES: hypothetical protein [Legionella]|nr:MULTISPECIES: hypothetical protein [Legionella]MBN9228896.1 hypothetical protein [Legionella steelei]
MIYIDLSAEHPVSKLFASAHLEIKNLRDLRLAVRFEAEPEPKIQMFIAM